MNGASIARALDKVAAGIARSHVKGERILLVGIQTGGVVLAKELARRLEDRWKAQALVGQVDVSMHRDDLDGMMAPHVHPTTIPFDLTGRTVVLVDDVLCSGRTTRAALDALTDFGRPKRVRLAVLVDRPHRELPIKADFVGLSVRTTEHDRVDVALNGSRQQARVTLLRAAKPKPTTKL